MASLVRGTAFITGAASGIGRQTALSFAKHGIQRLALADMNTKNLTGTIKDLKELYPHVDVLPLQMNVRKTPEVKSGIAETVKKFGRLDIAVNNAGIGPRGLTHELDEEIYESVIDVDLNGVWRCEKEELQVMLKQEDLGYRIGRGNIINVASMYGTRAPRNTMVNTQYTTAKHGVIGLTRGDANTYGKYSIRINAICPGFVDTPIIDRRLIEDGELPLAREIKRTPLERMAQPEEIGDAITFLASPLSSYVHGAAMVVDGGFTAC